MRCPGCGKEIPDHVDDVAFTCCDGVPAICPYCRCDLWMQRSKRRARVYPSLESYEEAVYGEVVSGES